ncbi:MAG TPA: 2-hydroxyacid dehydrogenase [Streptosporangiaceae bacterium]|jgi:lactate dehydrogenase-like 2-hydroxyacid dehydrogenase
MRQEPQVAATDPVATFGPIPPALLARLAADYPRALRHLPVTPARAELAAAERARVIVTTSKAGLPAAVMRDLPQLAAIINFGVGWDKIDLTAASARGLVISYTPDVVTDCVADIAVGLLIATLRSLPAADRFVRDGLWLAGRYPDTTKVSGQPVGIVGLGRIGRAIARRLDGFGCQISYNSRSPHPDAPYRYVPELTELARSCRALIITAAGGPETAGLISRPVLTALGDGYLINVARGSLVDDDALIDLLAAGRLGGAGLDVYASEPEVAAKLLALPNVVLLPHIGTATRETQDAMADLTVRNLDLFLREGSVLTPVPVTGRNSGPSRPAEGGA